MDRREFVRRCSLTLGALALTRWTRCAEGGERPASDADAASQETTPAGGEDGAGDSGADTADSLDWSTRGGLPNLGGAPDTEQGRAIAAFCDIVYPSAHRDPTGAPGALEAQAPAVFFDERLPAVGLVALFATLLDRSADDIRAGATLYDLTPSEREAALEKARTVLPEVDFAIQLAKVAALSSPLIGAHLGYPGPNQGYLGDPQLTFARAMATPHAATVDGNLP